MRCPICKQETLLRDNPYRPFCSERCKLIDLDNWLSERYRVSGPSEEKEEAASPPQPNQEAKGGRG
jgi:uncharacterized protein